MKKTTYKEKALKYIDEIDSRSKIYVEGDIWKTIHDLESLLVDIKSLLYSYDPELPLYESLKNVKNLEASFQKENSTYNEKVKKILKEFANYLDEFCINDVIELKQKAEKILVEFNGYWENRYGKSFDDKGPGFDDFYLDFKLLVYSYDPLLPINDYLKDVEERRKRLNSADSYTAETFNKAINKFISCLDERT